MIKWNYGIIKISSSHILICRININYFILKYKLGAEYFFFNCTMRNIHNQLTTFYDEYISLYFAGALVVILHNILKFRNYKILTKSKSVIKI